MNSLSWMIYAAGVAGGLKGLMTVAAVLGCIAIGICTVVFPIMEGDGERPKGSWSHALRYLWMPIVAGLIATLTPNSSTIYLIAASQAGETVVKSPDAIEMMGDLKAIIKKKLKEELAGSAE